MVGKAEEVMTVDETNVDDPHEELYNDRHDIHEYLFSSEFPAVVGYTASDECRACIKDL